MPTNEKFINMELGNLDYLRNAKEEIWQLFVATLDEFDGTEYMQGKKDGLRIALALLGVDGLTDYNRGGKMSRENFLGVNNGQGN